jgi:hypothetical protein
MKLARGNRIALDDQAPESVPAAYMSARMYLMSDPHIQQTTQNTPKTQAPSIEPPETRPLTTNSAPAIAHRTAKKHPTQ